MTDSGLKIAGFWLRIASSYLTLFFLLLNTAVLMSLIYFTRLFSLSFLDYRFWLLSLSVFLFLLLVDSVMQGLTGANLAKILLGLRLVDLNKNTTIGILRSFFRTFLSFFSLFLFGLGFVSMAFNLEKRSLHDALVSSRVLELPRAFLSKLFAAISVFTINLIGLLCSFSLVFLIFATPITLLKSMKDMSKLTSFESHLLSNKPKGKLEIPISNSKIFALNRIANYDYIEFDLDKTSKSNYIAESQLSLLGAKLTDYNLRLMDWQEDISKARLQLAVVIPEMIFKDTKEKDLVVKNQKFIINKSKTIIGQEFLNLFNYRVLENSGLLELMLFDEEAEIMAKSELSENEKYYLLDLLKKIRVSWFDYLSKLEAEELAEIEILSDLAKEKLYNSIEIKPDFKTGYVESVKLLKPSTNKTFNKLCKDFFQNSLPRFTYIPKSLESKSMSLEINLQYRALL